MDEVIHPDANAAEATEVSTPCCKICGSPTLLLGKKLGQFRAQFFRIYRCGHCGYAFVGNPWLDYGEIYTEAYYRGQGADPTVDYLTELEYPADTIRQYEWRGIADVVRSLTQVSPATRWLDFGCGNGGLVRFVRSKVGCGSNEHGWIKDRAEASGIPYLTDAELEFSRGTFDVVTAIEVLEHLEDRLSPAKADKVASPPGRSVLYTTGNAAPHRSKLSWSYARPEVHISFFGPELWSASRCANGFRDQLSGICPGFENIIRFKALKGLNVRRTALWRKAPLGIYSRD